MSIDSTEGGPPALEGVPVRVVRHDTQEEVGRGTTDHSGFVHFEEEAGLYDVAITVPEGWVLWAGSSNPTTVEVTPARTIWAQFHLLQQL